jgi:hypothetical protein
MAQPDWLVTAVSLPTFNFKFFRHRVIITAFGEIIKWISKRFMGGSNNFVYLIGVLGICYLRCSNVIQAEG